MFEQIDGKNLTDFNKSSEEFLAMMQSKGIFEPDEDLLGDGVSMIGVAQYPARIKCALLSWMAAKDAIIRAKGE
jgi:nitrogen fixation NifU-like protein